MKSIVFISAFLMAQIILIFGANCQNLKVSYYDKSWQKVDENKAVYKKEVFINAEGLTIVKKTTSKSKLIFEGSYKSLNPIIEHGAHKYYDKIGRIKFKEEYYEGWFYGDWIYYDTCGQVIEQMNFNDSYEYFKTDKYIEEDGFYIPNKYPKYLAKVASTKDSDLKNHYYDIIDPNRNSSVECIWSIAKEEEIRMNDSSYADFLNDLSSFSRYPRRCYSNNQEASVFVRVGINPEGSIVSIFVLNEVNSDFKQEIYRALMRTGKWKEAYNRKEPCFFYTIVIFKFDMEVNL